VIIITHTYYIIGEVTPTGYTGKAVLTTDTKANGAISDKDLAALIVKSLLATGGVFTRKEVTAVDPSLSGSASFTSLADSKLG
jgi:hypothetical protein